MWPRTATLTALSLLLVLPAQARTLDVSDDPSRGSDDAPLVLVEFSDLQCGACQGFVHKTLPTLQKEYVDTGKLRLVWVDNPLDVHLKAFDAAVGAECAARQDAFWGYHDAIYTYMNAERDALVVYADGLDLDLAAFEACLDDKEAKKAVRHDVRMARSMRLNSTPSFALAKPREDGKLEVLEVIRGGAPPLPGFKARIERHLGGE